MLKKIIILLLLFLFSGCSISKLAINQANPILIKLNTAIQKNSDTALVRDGIPSSLLIVEGLLESFPDNEQLLKMASEAYFIYSFAFIEGIDNVRASNLYLKSRAFALKILQKKDMLWGKISSQEGRYVSIEGFNALLSKLNKKDVPALFQALNSWMGFINLNLNNIENLLDIPKIESILSKLIELDENYYYGSPHALMAGYFASHSKVLGGDPQKAKKHFDRAFEISKSKFLLFHLLYAQYYAVQTQDKPLFENTLKKIISAPDDLLPEMNFINSVSKQKAKALLKNIDEYF